MFLKVQCKWFIISFFCLVPDFTARDEYCKGKRILYTETHSMLIKSTELYYSIDIGAVRRRKLCKLSIITEVIKDGWRTGTAMQRPATT